MEHASEYAYVYDNSDCEEIELNDDELYETAKEEENQYEDGFDPLRTTYNRRFDKDGSFMRAMREAVRQHRESQKTGVATDEDEVDSAIPVETTDAAARPAPAPANDSAEGTTSPSEQPAAEPPKHVKKAKVRKADPNIIAFRFNKLVEPHHMYTGDPIPCKKCDAYLSHISQLKDCRFNDQIWTCEFCSDENAIPGFSSEQKPAESDVTYMVEAAPTVSGIIPQESDDSIVVFCIDISGSMGTTFETTGDVRIFTDSEERRSSRPRTLNQISFVSRLEGAVMAIDYQMTKLVQQFPGRRVCLVTFESTVEVLGDCSSPSTRITENLHDVDYVMEEAGRIDLPRPILETCTQIRERVRQLRTLGSTALGPALAVSLTIAGRKGGSQVIMCTDGLANIGVGAFEYASQASEAELFYNQMKDYAVEHGVSVSVISIEGSDCKLSQLGVLADATGGQVNIVDPMRLREEFGSILANPILATNVVATLHLHECLYVRNEEAVSSTVSKNVGAVTGDQEITFEYGVRKATKVDATPAASSVEPDASKPAGIDLDAGTTPNPEDMDTCQERDARLVTIAEMSLSETQLKAELEGADARREGEEKTASLNPLSELDFLPFQLQLRYTGSDGTKAIRVFTHMHPVTRERSLAEEKANLRVVTTHSIQVTARLAEVGAYSGSRAYNAHMSNVVKTWGGTGPRDDGLLKRFNKMSDDLMGDIRRTQRTEYRTRGHTYSDDEDDVDGVPVQCRLTTRSLVTKMRNTSRNDQLAKTVFKSKKTAF